MYVNIDAAVVDNDPHPELAGHRGGYNGLARLNSTHRSENLFVPAYAGMNLELLFDGVEDEGARLFEPRRAPMVVERLDDASAVLYQPPTPHWRVESWSTFRIVEPHYVDFHFRVVPRADTFENGLMGLFWASYIDTPEDPGIRFVADTPEGHRWIRHHSPSHGVESTHRHKGDTYLIAEPDIAQRRFMHSSYSPWRYAAPYYVGVSHGMMYLLMFEDDPRIRFTQSPSGGGQRCPAWDFQYLASDYRVDESYEFSARLVYKPYSDHQDVVHEYAQWQRARSEPA